MTSISNFATHLFQETTNTGLQAQINTLTAESASGTYQDTAKSLGAQTSLLYSLQVQSAQQGAISTAATAVGAKLDTMQTAMTSINSLVSSAATSAVGGLSQVGDDDTEYNTLAVQGTGTMNQMLGLMNTSYNGQYLFSGQDGGTPAMAASTDAAGGPSAALSSVLSSAVAANGGPLTSSSVASLESKLSGMFSDSNTSPDPNYSGTFFTATDNGKPVSASIGGSQTMSYDMKGNSQSFRNVMQGLSMLSLLNAPSTQLDDSAKRKLLQDANSLISQGQAGLITDTAVIGSKQAQLATIVTQQKAAAAATQQQITNLDGIDPATTATKLTALQNALEASYTITSMISKLNFTSYMNG